jgi:hypothetical protein
MTHAELGAPRPDHDPCIRTLELGIGKTYGAREESARPLLLEDLSGSTAHARPPGRCYAP